jgi:hypothetical protein
MSWSRPLPKTIVLKEGREIKTLADARRLILSLPKQQQDATQSCLQPLPKATGDT